MISLIPVIPSQADIQSKRNPNNRISPKIKPTPENPLSERSHPYGGTLIMGVHTAPTMINPVLTQTSISASLMELIFDSLVRINSKGEIVPGLAESWDISEDGKEYTFYLRKGVLFHDGIELTAEDVKFTYEAINNPDNKSPWRTHTEVIQTFEILDRYTLKMVLEEPFTPILYKLIREIMPKHLLESKDLTEADFFNYFPVGSGPFRFKFWDKKTNQIELVFNPDYFEGRPYLDNVVVKTYVDVFQTWSAFMRHEVDLIQWITSDDYAVIKDDPGFRAYAVPLSMYYAMVYNVNDSIWRDRELRQAVAYGINIKEMMNFFPSMGGIESTGPFHPESKGYNPDVKPLGYDAVKAKMMLMHQGWQHQSQDAHGHENHVRRKGTEELELKVLVDERNEIYKKMAAIIRQQLSEIGVKVSVVLYKDDSALTKELLEQLKPNVWLRLFVGLGTGEGYDVVGSWYFLSSQWDKLWGYNNLKVNRLYEQARVSQDENNRVIIYKKIHQIIYEDQPANFLFFPSGYFAINKKFLNTDNFFNWHMPYWTIKDWYIAVN